MELIAEWGNTLYPRERKKVHVSKCILGIDKREGEKMKPGRGIGVSADSHVLCSPFLGTSVTWVIAG